MLFSHKMWLLQSYSDENKSLFSSTQKYANYTRIAVNHSWKIIAIKIELLIKQKFSRTEIHQPEFILFQNKSNIFNLFPFF